MKCLRLWFLLSLLFSQSSYSEYWHATVESELTIDNRIQPKASVEGKTRLNYQYQDPEQGFHMGVNVDLDTGQQSEGGVKAIRQLYAEKNNLSQGMTLKAGRFERSDNLGFYLLDGVHMNKRFSVQDSELNLYVGKPHRVEDNYSIDGDTLFGLSLNTKLGSRLLSEYLGMSIDQFDTRVGLQFLTNNSISKWLNLGVSIEGGFLGACCDHYDVKLMTSYNLDRNTFEDIALDGLVEVNQNLNVRATYQFYRPEENSSPTFKEQFFNLYALGNQQTFRFNTTHRLDRTRSWQVEGIRVTQESGRSGYGFSTDFSLMQSPDVRWQVGAEHIFLGEDKLQTLRLSVVHEMNALLDLKLHAILRHEKKQLSGINDVAGLSLNSTYLLNNDLILKFEVSGVLNSRLRNEYSAGVNLTYYFEPYRAKTSSQYYPRIN